MLSINYTKDELKSFIINLLEDDSTTEEELNKLYGDSTLLVLTYENEMLDIMKLLINDPRVDINKDDSEPLFTRIVRRMRDENDNKRMEYFMALYESPGLNMNVDEDGITPLMWACKRASSMKIIKLLFNDPRIDINYRTKNGNTAFSILCRNYNGDDMSIIKMFLEDKRINLSETNDENMSILACAVEGGNSKIIELLLENNNIDPNIRNSDGKTAFHMACSYINNEMAKLFLNDPRVDVNIADNDGKMPIQVASENVMKILRENARVKIDRDIDSCKKTIKYTVGHYQMNKLKIFIELYGEDMVMNVLKE